MKRLTQKERIIVKKRERGIVGRRIRVGGHGGRESRRRTKEVKGE